MMRFWGAQERPTKPSEVTIRFAPKALVEIIAAPGACTAHRQSR